MIQFPVGHGLTAMIDDEDEALLARANWYAMKDYRTQTWYCMAWERTKDGRHRLAMHRILMNDPKGMLIDHVDGNGLNNQRENLRLATCQQNSRNRISPRQRAGTFKGLNWDAQRGKWMAKIYVNYRCINLGRYPRPEDAARAYDRAAVAYFGQFAKLNFPVSK